MDAIGIEQVVILIFSFSLACNIVLTVLYRKMKRLAFSHELTGLPNKRDMTKITRPLYAELIRGEKTSITTVAMDLRSFKAINSEYGHSNGDEVLRVVGRLLEKHSRATDIVGHHSGDEFSLVVAMRDTNETQDPEKTVSRIVDNVNSDLRVHHFEFAQGAVDTRLDMGISTSTSKVVSKKKASVVGYTSYWDAYDEADKDCERKKDQAVYVRR